jgi:predicted ATP-binding protein involved in virulence
MNLASVVLKNYRLHRDLAVSFRPGFNVIVGVNGSGKTSLLKAICDALTGFTAYISDPHGYLALDESDIAFLRSEVVNGRFRFESQYPVTVEAKGNAFGAPCHWKVIKGSQVEQAALKGRTPGTAMQESQTIRTNIGTDQPDFPLPLVAFYRANRQWNKPRPTEMQAATEKMSRNDAYAFWSDASLDASAFQGWVISKCLERFQTSSETGRMFDDIDDDELALVSSALSKAVEGFKGIRYDIKQKSLLIDLLPKSGEMPSSISFENLSDGQKGVIGLVADIARRACLLNPMLGNEATTKTTGVVLIDELDMHLHPRWQRMLTNGLERAFPSMQFIVASHSPQVIGELHPDEIILLRQGGMTHPQVSYGLSSSQILEEIMGAEARNVEVENSLSTLFEALERNQLDLAQQLISNLTEAVPGLPELAGAAALLKRKQVLGR